ncbi:EcsC family protein [Melissospora conviva]|uniref:EcsC family protein n=1 Tax=Melissospora conviva TaxID=3388432 RepID=UPI003C1CEF26
MPESVSDESAPSTMVPASTGDAGEVTTGDATETGDALEIAGPPDGLWARMKADPTYAPEHLALEAVRRFGPEAAEWAARMRAARPGITPDALADLAVGRFLRRARLSGAVSGAAGIVGAVADVGVLAWAQSRMVLHIAAAYGADPTHADRATDLLVLQKVHGAAQSARLALGVAVGRRRLAEMAGRGGLGVSVARLGVKLAQMAGLRAAHRVFAKVVPGAAVILGTWANSSATRDLARRARDHYRTGRTA